MKYKFFLPASVFLTLLLTKAFPQQSPVTFGAMTKEEFNEPLYPGENGAEAIMLLNYADAHIVYTRGNNNEPQNGYSQNSGDDGSGFKIESNCHIRIKILKPSGYDYANVALTYPNNYSINGLKAVVYNIENDELVATRLKNKDITIEKTSDYYSTRRFTFPQVKEGSVVEYTYKVITSDIYEFIPFSIQQEIPVRFAQFWASYPEYFIYNIKRKGIGLLNESYSTVNGYFNTQSTNFNVYLWIGTNLPAFQPEPFLPALDDHMAGIDFELAGVDFPGGSDAYASPTYARFTERLLNSSIFGSSLDNRLLLAGKVTELTQGTADRFERMKILFNYVRNEIKWNGDYSFLQSQSLKKTYTNKNGNSADVNLMLITLLRSVGITAHPVILSTREHGTLNKMMAFEGNFDYVICYAETGGKEYLLDATNKDLPLGYLPDYCLNGEGWLVSDKTGRFIALHNSENDYYSGIYNLTINPDGSAKGIADIELNGYVGFDYRNDFVNLGIKYFISKKLVNTGRVKYDSLVLEGIENPETPFIMKFNMEYPSLIQSSGDIYFFNPAALDLLAFHNDFIKEEREFPVNLPCPEYRNFVYTIKLPENFTITEVPKSQKFTLLKEDGMFTYGINVESNVITITTNFNVNKTYYEPEEYPALREFYTQVFRKLNEMIIIKNNNSLSKL